MSPQPLSPKMGRSWSPALADILGSALPALPTCGAAYSRICCEDGPRSGFRIHPAALDACLQLGAAVPRVSAGTEEKAAFVPAGFEVRVHIAIKDAVHGGSLCQRCTAWC